MSGAGHTGGFGFEIYRDGSQVEGAPSSEPLARVILRAAVPAGPSPGFLLPANSYMSDYNFVVFGVFVVVGRFDYAGSVDAQQVTP